jgi:hypothetical protein
MTKHYLHVFPNLALLRDAWKVEQEKATLVGNTDKLHPLDYTIVTEDERKFHLVVVRDMEDVWRFAGQTWSGVRFHGSEFSFPVEVVTYLKCCIRQPKGEE